MLPTFTHLASLACFLAVTSKGPEGRMLVSFDAIKTIVSSAPSCNYGVAVDLKNGQQICVIDSLDKIARSLSTQKSCGDKN
jgi:hypothetical protein